MTTAMMKILMSSLPVSSAPRPIFVVLWDGQSLSIGAGETGVPPVSTTVLTPWGRMLSNGPANPRSAGIIETFAGVDSFVGSFEVQFSDSVGETQNTRSMYEMEQQALAGGGDHALMLSMGIGASSQTITQLNPPNDIATSAVNAVTKIIEICAATNLIPTFVVAWSQGEAQRGNTAAQYCAEIINRANTFYDGVLLPIIQTLVPAHPSLTVHIQQISMDQSGDPSDVALGQLLAVQTDSRFRMGPPEYPYLKANQFHITTAPGRQYWGALMAASMREYIDNAGAVTYLRHVRVTTPDNINFTATFTDHPTNDNIIQLTDGPIQVNAASIIPSVLPAALTDGGFIFEDFNARVTSVAVASPTTLLLTANPAPRTGGVLRYADSITSHIIGDAKGTVTDSRGGVSTYDGKPLHRWAIRKATPIEITYTGDDPSVLTGIYGWFRADTGRTESLGRTTAWAAKQGASSFTFPTVGKQPILAPAAVNGKDALYFNVGRKDFGTWSGVWPTGDFATVAILREGLNAVSGSTHILTTSLTNQNGRHQFFYSPTVGAGGIVTGAGPAGESKTVPYPGSYVRGTTLLMPATSFPSGADRRVWTSVNGGAFQFSNASVPSPFTALNAVSLGCASGVTNGNMDAYLCDLFIFNRSLDAGLDLITFYTLINYAKNYYGAVW